MTSGQEIERVYSYIP